MVGGDAVLATALGDAADLVTAEPGDAVITQGGADDDLYLVVSGKVEIWIHGRLIAERPAGTHVGEMALIDPKARRSATVVAKEACVFAKISEPAFSKIANAHPGLWRALAVELGDRLRERTKFIRVPNEKPLIFVGSSREALTVANALHDALQSPEIDVRVWTDGVFGASRFPLEDLEKQLGLADFAVLVVAADDQVASRGTTKDAPRDNVVFELGLFMGGLTRSRTFMLAPRGMDIKIPTDLLGLTPLLYEQAKPADDVAKAANELRDIAMRVGPR
jgi:CRP/FNR family transcriptional regulator, cyclic AMP receptor protein